MMGGVRALVCASILVGGSVQPMAADSRAILQETLNKVAKIHGAGGVRGLESYQSGLVVSSDGVIVTTWSYVLDTEAITVVLHDGRRYTAELLGMQPQLEVAVLKIEAQQLPCFDLDQAATPDVGDSVWALANLYGVATGNEPVSVMRGHVAAQSELIGRRGAFDTPYRGPVLILDAITNNAGAAGGALTDRTGRLIGILGKELRNAQDDTWLNYAIPISQIREDVRAIVAGQSTATVAQRRPPVEPLSPWVLGIVLVPQVLPQTPAYVESIVPSSPAERAGLRADDLIVFVDQRAITSRSSVIDSLGELDQVDPVRVTVLRNNELIEVILQAD